VHTVTVTHLGAGGYQVLLPRQDTSTTVPGETATTEKPDEGPSPIAPEGKELLWGAGAFLVFLVLMRVWLFPKVKKGMDARYGKIRGDLETADATKLAAEREVAEYQAQLAAVRAEASSRIDAARQTLEAERSARLTQVNSGIAARRADVAAQAESARTAAQQSVEAAVASVADRAAELSIGRRPSPGALQRAVSDAMSAGVSS
jgi:F-type H+-transporting ATPase subunit b